jgi:epoxyqueuosine reductase
MGMAAPRLEDRLKAQARAEGFASVGVARAGPSRTAGEFREWLARGMHGSMGYLERSAELRADVGMLLAGARSVVACSMHYSPEPPPPEGARVARYALGRDYHRVLRGRLRRIGKWLESELPGTRSRACVDSAPVLEREWAQRAGLGWFGKNTCLIDSRRGSWFVLGVLLTTAELEPDPEAVGGCGTCRACVDACPTGAIVHAGGRWQVDSRLCISYLTIEHRGPFLAEQQRAVGGWTFGCDVCQEVCPFNAPRASQPGRAPGASVPDLAPGRRLPPPSELVRLGEQEWDELTRGSAVRRAGLEGLRRNALANLANAQSPQEK